MSNEDRDRNTRYDSQKDRCSNYDRDNDRNMRYESNRGRQSNYDRDRDRNGGNNSFRGRNNFSQHNERYNNYGQQNYENKPYQEEHNSRRPRYGQRDVAEKASLAEEKAPLAEEKIPRAEEKAPLAEDKAVKTSPQVTHNMIITADKQAEEDGRGMESTCAAVSLLTVIYKRVSESSASSSLASQVEIVLSKCKKNFTLFLDIEADIGKSSFPEDVKQAYKDVMTTFMNFTRRIMFFSGCSVKNKAASIEGLKAKITDMFVKDSMVSSIELLFDPLASICHKLELICENILDSLKLFDITSFSPFLSDLKVKLSLLDNLFVESAKRLSGFLSHTRCRDKDDSNKKSSSVLEKRDSPNNNSSCDQARSSRIKSGPEKDTVVAENASSMPHEEGTLKPKPSPQPVIVQPKDDNEQTHPPVDETIKETEKDQKKPDYIIDTRSKSLEPAGIKDSPRSINMEKGKELTIHDIEKFINKYSAPSIKICKGKVVMRVFHHPYHFDPAHKGLHEERIKAMIAQTKITYYCTLKRFKNTKKGDFKCNLCGMDGEWYNNETLSAMRLKYPHLFESNNELFFKEGENLQATSFCCEDCRLNMCVWCYSLI